MSSNEAPASHIPPEAIEFASRLYNAARAGQMDVFEQALPAGLPANLTNEKGDTLVRRSQFHLFPYTISYIFYN